MTPEPHIDGATLLARMPPPALQLARSVCSRLAEGGHRGWIVGGAVRDLVLERPLVDLDLVSDALPDAVEGLFDRTVAVGKSFGVVVVVLDGQEVEVATFRKERGYSDRRRPDEVEYALDPEVDARRRDFTCNALYLDPLTGEVRDPEGGLADLTTGRLRAVGDAAGRFREDGLRILRMARFLAGLGLVPAPGLLESARQEAGALEGVSAERVRDELRKMLLGPAPAVAVRLMVEGGHAERVLPAMGDAGAVERRLGALAVLRDLAVGDGQAADLGPGRFEAGLAILFGGEPGETQLAEALRALRCSREEVRQAESIDAVAVRLRSALDREVEELPADRERRGGLVDLWRDPARPLALAVLEARSAAKEGDSNRAAREARAGAVAALAALSAEALAEPVVVPAEELVALGVERGPELGEWLRRVRLAGLGGAFADRAGALQWVRERLA